ncbi:SAMP-activating enzyme E1 [Halobacterium bonnevillei]|uniref:Molybdopterin-synthase adenylyltransferase MoeB n=1 Tax=Halobacterium bonnevillei TaxID=2692200 RepID=A0A6B0SKN8_9EURY|nr:molybdopterin-synthase adenylyltransferase MoeB [Halobacterium bonnevillei]MXR22374.1 molybdopterin-synthase adenylyltransferase MoeB [Halobacterium bonnevillei]
MSGLNLDPVQLDRYSRHIIMEDVGPEGQRRLLDADVLVVGAGGLGAPVIQYLAAAGVGTLRVVDDDEVERSNLQRQIIHADADVGRPKAESAREYVEALNPDVDVHAHVERLDQSNVDDLLDGVDFVVDCSDNFPTRYLVNDACVLRGIPFSHAAIYRFEGQAITYEPGSACYRCLFPEAPPEGTIPDCATAGVLGILPGTMGCIQATECVKGLLDYGDLLTGRLLFYDAADMTFETVPVETNPDCPVCSEDPDIDSVQEVEYAEGCAVSP